MHCETLVMHTNAFATVCISGVAQYLSDKHVMQRANTYSKPSILHYTLEAKITSFHVPKSESLNITNKNMSI